MMDLFKSDVPVSKPTLVAEKGYPVEMFENADVAGLAAIYQKSCVELMRRAECNLLPTVFLHLRRDPFTHELNDGLYELHMEDSDQPYMRLKRLFEMCIRLAATQGQARGIALCMRVSTFPLGDSVTPDVDKLSREQGEENMLVTVEGEKFPRHCWLAPFSPCYFHGLHAGAFEPTADEHAIQPFGSFMEPYTVMDVLNKLRGFRPEAGALEELAKKLGLQLEKM